MAKVGEIIAGAALIAGAITLDVVTGGAALGLTAAEFGMLVSTVASMGVSVGMMGISGLLQGPPQGAGTSTQNPIKSWDIVYGQVKVGGTVVYTESNGGILSQGSNTYDKCFQAVYMLAAHPIKSIDQVRMNGKQIPLGPPGAGGIDTEWTFTPDTNQNRTTILSASRASGVVTIKLASGLADMNGQMLSIQYVTDNTFNGQFTVTQPNPADETTFTYQNGGPDTTTTTVAAYVLTTLPDYKNRIHVDRTSCLGTHSTTFPELLSNSTLWTPAHRNLGKASCYIGYYYDQTVFQDGIPPSSFVISGKSDIYDPRLGDFTNPAAHVYTTNAALIIADYLANTTWGFGSAYGTQIPLPQLIAAANICDEQIPLAAGGTEARYTINMTFSLNQTRSAVLEEMTNACAGRITNVNGQWIISPGAWVGPSINLTQDDLVGPIEFKPILTISDSCNGVKGTYTSPVNNWQAGDIPPYAEDELHGYGGGDRWLADDGGVRIWKDVGLSATTSCPTAQRLLKIDLERLRREGRLTLHCNMTAYTVIASDVIEFSFARYGWVNKQFEVLSSKLIFNADSNGGAPTLGVDLDLAETDSDVYDWSTSEELTPNDSPSPAIDNGQTVLGPQTLIIASGSDTTVVGADGVCIPRIRAGWELSPDSAVQSGGYIAVQFQKEGDTFWTPAGTVPGTATQCYISGVVDGQNYSVQTQAFTAKGVSSSFAQAGPITCSATKTFMSASNITYPDGTPVGDLEPAEAGADTTSTNIPTELITNGSFEKGLTGWTTIAGTVAIDASQKKYGQQSCSIHGGSIIAATPLTLIAGHTYTLQGWVKTNGSVVGNGSLGAGFNFNDPNGYIRVQKTNGVSFNAGSQNPGVVLAATSAWDWNQIQFTFSVTTSCSLKFGMTDCYGSNTTLNGTAWFDGISLIDITGGADVTSAQAMVYAGTSESIIPNGNFTLGNLDGWFVCEGSGSFTYAGFGNGQSGLVIGGGGTVGVGSPTFSVIPGKKYKITYRGMADSGSQSVFLRINYAATNLPQINSGNRTGSTDFESGWSGMAVRLLTDYAFDWTCPSGVYFASAAVYEWSNAPANIYILGISCVPYAGSGEWGADVTLNQPQVYSGSTESIIPNGNFILGNLNGWANGSNLFSYGVDQFGPRIYSAGNVGSSCFSPSFNVIPGKKYRFAAKLYNTSGSGGIYFRLAWQATYSPFIDAINGTSPSSVPGFQDFLNGGSVTNVPTVYDTSGIGDWTCPAGANYASVIIYAVGSSDLACEYVSCIPYGATGQFGADVTGLNTAASITGQGALATKNQTNTVDIVANAVSANVVAQHSNQQIVTPNGTEIVVAQATITAASSGFVEVSTAMTLAAGAPCIPTVTLWKGGVGGQILSQASDIGVARTNVTDNSTVPLIAIDSDPNLAQQYTVTINAGFSTTVYCNYIWLIVKNFKV